MNSENEIIATSFNTEKAPKVNILLVDDRPENIISLASILEDDSRIILKANSGNEALKIALEQEIAVMLLDVQMPEMDGFEVARLLKENSRTKDIAIIFVTAINKDEKFTMQGYDEGAVDYLHKPLDINIVKAKVVVFEKLYRQRIELKAANERLIKTNKQLDEFVYIVSHDLKAPLRGIASLCSFIEEEVGEPKPELEELLDLMKSRLGRMQSLIDGILHYSRMGNSTGAKEDVDVKDLIINIIDLVDIGNHIKVEFPDTFPNLYAERIKLHEVFQNLISNGIKYNDKEKGLLKIGYKEYPDHFEFSVEDNGIGIKPEHFEKIFQLFQTLVPKDKTESTGLGLTIVKKIVEQQGGKVTVESRMNEGSKFSFTWMK
jgi:two-component system, sensor histidine kinase and response regulator